jgi:hypothetical protein
MSCVFKLFPSSMGRPPVRSAQLGTRCISLDSASITRRTKLLLRRRASSSSHASSVIESVSDDFKRILIYCSVGRPPHKAEEVCYTLTVMPIRKFDSMLDALLSVEVKARPGSSPAVAILREQSGLRAYRLSENVGNAIAQMSCIGSPASKQVTYDLMRIDDIAATPVWFESVNPATRTREGYLIEPRGNHAWAVSTYVETETGFATAFRTFTLRQDGSRAIRVEPNPDRTEKTTEILQIADAVMATLTIVSSPMLTEIVKDKPPRRGMVAFNRIRIAEPWTDLEKQGVPKVGKATRPTYVADEILDETAILEGRIWMGLHQFDKPEQRDDTVRQIVRYRRGLENAMRLVLSPLTAMAATEVAGHERAGMDKAREMVVLPDFLTWIEWRDAPCGVPGQRWGVLLQAAEDEGWPTDARGLLFAFPAEWKTNKYSFNALPMLCFDLRLKSADKPLLDVTETSIAMAAAGGVDGARLGRFLLATLTFIGQPRMAEQVDAGGSVRQTTDRARIARGLGKQVAMREVRLVIDVPGEIEDEHDAYTHRDKDCGVGLGGMPLYRVRMFWRWRLGRLEVVRPHYRGSAENGVSRRITLVLHPNEVAVRSPGTAH